MAIVINGERIEETVIQAEAERLRPDHERVFAEIDPEKREAQLLDWSRENVIERVLLIQQAKEQNEPVSKEKLRSALTQMQEQSTSGKSFDDFSDEEKEKIEGAVEIQIRVENLLRDVCKDIGEASQQEAEDFYNNNKERFQTAEQRRVAHIVKHTNSETDEQAAQEIMTKVHQQLNSGEVFETLVTKHSDCPENGGDLGYITKGQMVEEFEDVVFNLGTGQISNVFHSRFGFHIARVYDIKPGSIVDLETAKESIKKQLKSQMDREAIEKFVDRLKSNAAIENVS
ncbi:peptidylprolyl isomerase [Planctomycetota bacterium]